MSCITCPWLSSRRLVINPDGQVFPCCFFANITYISKMHGYPKDYDSAPPEDLRYELADTRLVSYNVPREPLLADYIKNEEHLNLNNNSMEDILNHSWFKTLYESWEDSSKVSRICLKHCSK